LAKNKKNNRITSSQSFAVKADKDISELKNKIEHLNLLNSAYSTSMPRNLSINAVKQNSIAVIQRDAEYIKRHEMYEDTFVREMVKVIIVRAIGTTHDNVKPFELTLSDDVNIDDKFKEIVKDELKYLENLISKNIIDIALDSQFYGDGYVRVVSENQKGVTAILSNYSTKPFNITPIRTNKLVDVAYEVSNNQDIIKTSDTANFESIVNRKNSRFYVSTTNVARMNAQGNGISYLSTEQVAIVNNMNVFDDNTYVYEDGIYGGVVEGCYDDYISFKWAIKALANARIANSIIERFIIQPLNTTSDDDKRLLQRALEKQIQSTLDSLATKISDKSPDVLIANHIIPTTSDGTNNIQIQESSPNFNGFQNIEDIMIHIRKFIGSIGFNFDMTSFAQTLGGRERDGVVENSLQMDAQGTQIRQAIRDYVLHISKVHFLAKYDLDIDIEKVEVNFTSVMNHAKMSSETQRMEAITNLQQLQSIIDGYKNMNIEDNEINRIAVKTQLEDILSSTSKNKDEQIEMLLNVIFTKNKEDGEEM